MIRRRIKKIKETKEERYERIWCEKFELMCEYKNTYNTFKVSIKKPGLPQKFKFLGSWQYFQRKKK
jgi:hypothetical protein